MHMCAVYCMHFAWGFWETALPAFFWMCSYVVISPVVQLYARTSKYSKPGTNQSQTPRTPAPPPCVFCARHSPPTLHRARKIGVRSATSTRARHSGDCVDVHWRFHENLYRLHRYHAPLVVQFPAWEPGAGRVPDLQNTTPWSGGPAPGVCAHGLLGVGVGLVGSHEGSPID